MAKRNNSLGRRTYGGKPYDANNSFVKKMATRVTDLIPQRSWISKWFNAPQDNGDVSNEDDNLADGEEETQQPPAKRPRIRMDITHPPGTFSIKPRDKDSAKNHGSEMTDETEEYFLEPVVAGPSGACKFVSSTPAIHTDVRNSNSQRGAQLSLLHTGNNGASNGTDDNSESGESTSGCSSLIPQTNRQDGASNSHYSTSFVGGRNRFIDDKSSFANNLQSPRCLFLATGGRESSASRRPSFNASMMSIDGNNVDRSSSLSSPFYSGNVTFGGANALGSYKRSRSLFNSTNEFQLKIPRRTRVEVKPSNGESVDASGMSQTAKRILEAMEYFSSPISDAKKIPMKKMSETSGGTKRSREERSLSSFPTSRVGLRHLTRELAVPTVPEMLKLRRRQKLQDTTVAARKIISAMSGPAPASACPATMATPMAATGTLSSGDYHLRTESDDDPKYHGKLRGTSKKNPDDEGPAPSVNLPNITLAITSLPSFEPLPKYTKPPINSNSDGKSTEDHRHGYKFASPIKITEASWNLKSINNFSFSKPINADDSEISRIDSNIAIKSADSKAPMNNFHDAPATNFMWSGSSTAPRMKVKTKQNDANLEETGNNVSVKSAAVKEMAKLKTVSKDTDSRTSRAITKDEPSKRDIWECSECYIKNDSSEKKCVACKTPKLHSTGSSNNMFSKLPKQVANDNGTTRIAQTSKSTSSDNGFGSQFKLGVNDWECESCLVRNQMTSIKCVSCSSPKPAGSKKQIDGSLTIASKAPTRNDLAEKFKPAEGSWECSGCMLRNPSSFITCPCCNTAKPSLTRGSAKETSLDVSAANESNKKSSTKETGFENATTVMDKFKRAANTWECSSCLVRNADTANTCVCCSNPKPGVTANNEKDSTPRASIQPGWGDQFKKPEGSWSCDSCMLQNKSDANECVACNALKPGAAPKSQTSTSQFSFGVPAQNQGFKFGIDKAEVKTKWSPSSKVTNGFDFGAKTAQTNVEPGQFTFGIPKQPDASETSAKASTVSTGGFVFASPKSPKDNNAKIETNRSNEFSTESGKPSCEQKKDTTPFQFGFPKSANDRPESIAQESKKEDAGLVTKSDSDKVPFVFGVPKSHENPSNDGKSKFEVQTSEKPSIFGKTSQTMTNNETKNTTVTQTETPVSSSVTSPSANASAPARTPFTFSDLNPKMASPQTSSITPNFGQTSIPPSTSSFSIIGTSASLGANSAPTENTNKPIASNFGIHNSVTPSTGFGIQNSSPSTVLADTPAADVKISFAAPEKLKSTFFGVSCDNKTPVFGAAMEKKNQIFGNPDNKLPPAFGSNDKQVSGNTMFNSVPASSAFGVSTCGTAQSVFGNSSAPVFGGNTATPSFGSGSTVATSNIFASAGKSNVNPVSAGNQGLFTFGGANNQQITSNQSTSGTYSFGADNGDAASSARKTIFSFGNAGNNSQPNAGECFGNNGTNTGTFGTPASTVTNPSSSPFTFNAPSSKQDPPAFGQTSAAIPNIFGTQGVSAGMGQQTPAPAAFATNATTSSTGFSFGAAPSSTISGGFNFSGGMAQPAAPPSGGFNFNAPSPSPTIAFDPNTRPSFNFTGGTAPTAFNATPQPVAARRIKKAVRRMQQR